MRKTTIQTYSIACAGAPRDVVYFHTITMMRSERKGVRIVAECADDQQRCPWALLSPLMLAYHDQEWGVPCHDDNALFERFVLETFQAGLSWSTVLNKRENFRSAFEGWDALHIAAYGPAETERLMGNAGIIRNQRKIEATIRNARCFLETQHAFGSFDRYIWSFVDGQPLQRHMPLTWAAVPAQTAESAAMAKDLRRRGFVFVGPVMCYAFMQSIGMVNDHVRGCFKAASTDV